ncbi:NUDIX hydrolase [Nocardiopsis alba]|uniref:NUDIX hydrolase n=1 Tax=Nocardiopsis alba TaxID=53437 RepID=UPI0035E067B2
MSDAREIRDKALCYVVREGRLLVFRHVDASPEEVGLQVPAGSVRPGETPEAAALREGREETGLTGLRVVRPLGVVEYDITPYRFEVQRRHVFHLEVDGPVPERWTSFEEHDGVGEPTRLECLWIPLSAGHVLQSGQGALLGRLYDPPRDRDGRARGR